MTQERIKNDISHRKLRKFGFEVAFNGESDHDTGGGAIFTYYTRRPKNHGEPIVTAILMTYKDRNGWKLFIEAGANTIDIDDTLDDFERLLDESLCHNT